MTQAALGGEIEVPAIDGSKARVKIPAGTQTGDQFRLRGKGFSVLRSAARGDMYIQVAVETPQHLTRRQRELLEEFEAEATGNTKGHPESEGLLRQGEGVLRGRRQRLTASAAVAFVIAPRSNGGNRPAGPGVGSGICGAVPPPAPQTGCRRRSGRPGTPGPRPCAATVGRAA